ncbi:hypothetical protein K488DRAFT_89851 [Vararia minispora EC-137]|uniref:Uncharacterized protein n=1 Tax=Vararia minispora EC-137 TaxID=1314806 RepID=A0ACB8Q9B5_9AGAM|nr:hypothetical protein K488DRAFT_89851 [Vararia minispora EC-137]
MLLFYDLVPRAGGPTFSPATTPVRLALLHKGISFEVVELTYKQLRLDGWGDKAGRDNEGTATVRLKGRATVPFIQREDGSFIRDSTTIIKWLDKEYPDKPCIFLPDAPLPVDTASQGYLSAVDHAVELRRTLFSRDAYIALFMLYAPKMTAMMEKDDSDNDYDYFTSDERLGDGFWKTCLDADPGAHFSSPRIDAILSSPPGRQFLASSTTPGYDDFSVMGVVRMLAGTSAENYARTFGRGKVGEWVQKMNERFADGEGGMRAVTQKDPK